MRLRVIGGLTSKILKSGKYRNDLMVYDRIHTLWLLVKQLVLNCSYLVDTHFLLETDRLDLSDAKAKVIVH